MPKKFYAVRSGRVPGIYTSWDLCKAQVIGFAGAAYKGFETRQEAQQFMSLTGSTPQPAAKQQPAQLGSPLPIQAAIAYVDGSYRDDTKEFACGAVLFYGGAELTFSQKFADAGLNSMRNVAGEIMGARTVIAYCLEKGISALEIRHDYEGVAKWCTGEWKANKPGTQDYRAYCAQAMEKMTITFTKVKGHSGDKYNDAADALAKKALGL